jgi:Tfp pilus assembly protein FimV
MRGMEIGQTAWIIIIAAMVVIGLLGLFGTHREPRTALGSDTHKGMPASSSTPSDTDEDVNPVTEAEVYLAYGRKEQAIEILEEALRAKPAREDIRRKLQEIKAGK